MQFVLMLIHYVHNYYHKKSDEAVRTRQARAVGVFNYIKKEKKLERRRNENSSSNHAAKGGQSRGLY